MYEIKASLVRRSDTLEIVGMALQSGPEGHSEFFCAKFPAALSRSQAEVRVEGQNLRFEMGTRDPFQVELNPHDADELGKLLAQTDIRWTAATGMMFTPGFRLNRSDVPADLLIKEQINGENKGEVRLVTKNF